MKQKFTSLFPNKAKSLLVLIVAGLVLNVSFAGPVYANVKCGAGDEVVTTSIDFGCSNKGNPIVDLAFAIIRFLSVGVGIVVVGSLILAGIQYTTSSGDPQATAAALKRIANTVAALVLYIFIFALLNWLIPAGLLK